MKSNQSITYYRVDGSVLHVVEKQSDAIAAFTGPVLGEFESQVFI